MIHERVVFIKNLKKNIRHVYIIARIEYIKRSITKNGDPYYELAIKDLTGSIRGFIWKNKESFYSAEEIKVGDVVSIFGNTKFNNGKVSLDIDKIDLLYRDEKIISEPSKPKELDVFLGKDVVFDIETVPFLTIRDIPESVAEKVEEKGEAEGWDVDKVMSLSPIYGKIISIAFVDADNPEISLVTIVPHEQKLFGCDLGEPFIAVNSEKILLSYFWRIASISQRLITFNGRRFDIPFIIVRSVINEVPIEVDLLGSRFDQTKHFDVYEFISCFGAMRGPHSLDACCFGFGIDSPKKSFDGEKVKEAYFKGNLESIGLYNLEDVKATQKLYKKIQQSLNI